MTASRTVYLRLSQVAPEFVEASLDLLQAALTADEVLVTDEIREAAARLRSLCEENRGDI